MHILNTEEFGFMIKAVEYKSFEHARAIFNDFKLENLGKIF